MSMTMEKLLKLHGELLKAEANLDALLVKSKENHSDNPKCVTSEEQILEDINLHLLDSAYQAAMKKYDEGIADMADLQ